MRKVALVTGGSSGIGAAIATELARGGASVTVSYLRNEAGAVTTVETIEGLGQSAFAYALRLSLRFSFT